MKKINIQIILILSLFSLHTFADDSTDLKTQKHSVSISQNELFVDFESDTVDIYINSFLSEYKGFALKVAVQSQYFNIDNIVKGDFLNSCGWELFNSKQAVSNFATDNELQIWKIVGLSEIFPDSISPSCFVSDSKTSIAKIIISRNIHAQQIDSAIPIFFIWEECADNTLSGMSGNELFVSNKVFQFDKNQPQFESNRFPTTQGIPPNCINTSVINAPVKSIEFLPGGVVLKDRIFDDSLILNK